jgi:glycosyltransferase involved in cell wall biosynthesis
VGTLLDAYQRLILGEGPRGPVNSGVPELVLAGRATVQSQEWLHRIERPPLKNMVRHIGYVEPVRYRELYEGARLLVQPSFEEGFGIPVLEAMTLGVPVIASSGGALPEVLGDAGLLFDPESPAGLGDAIARILDDEACAAECVRRGVARSREFRWDLTARCVYDAYRRAVECRSRRTRPRRP